ncbi:MULTISPECIES: hypothetical protein [unclassified Streptomyces]|uniref:hypothetical protein n=1 Tax=unclassified Streptomyces TaxID=2593676 RepID=UPI003404BFF8
MATPTNPNEGGKTVPAAQLAFKVVKWEALEDGEKVFVKEDEVTFDHPVARDKDDRPLVESAIKWWDLEYYSNKTSPVELPYSHGLVRTQIVSVSGRTVRYRITSQLNTHYPQDTSHLDYRTEGEMLIIASIRPTS